MFPKASILKTYDEKLIKENFLETFTAEGNFEFYSDGFFIDRLKYPELIEWKKITKIIAYKRDLIVIDSVTVEIFTDKWTYKISEESKGWFYFVEQLNKYLNIKNKNWFIDTCENAFQQNLQTIYSAEKVT